MPTIVVSASDRQVVAVGRVGSDVALINVVSEDRVECRHVARHAGHERRHQRGQPDAQHAGSDRTAPSEW